MNDREMKQHCKNLTKWFGMDIRLETIDGEKQLVVYEPTNLRRIWIKCLSLYRRLGIGMKCPYDPRTGLPRTN